MLEIFERSLCKQARSIGIGMGRTMRNFSKILPDGYAYYPASNQTSIFLREKIVLPLQNTSAVDVYFDSADVYDASGNLIKGGGGAFTLEKLLMKMAKTTVIVVHKEKRLETLKGQTVPVEILKDSRGYFIDILKKYNLKGELRTVNGLSPFLTDNGNYIFDVEFGLEFINICKDISGVIEHGYVPREMYFQLEEL